MGRVKRQHILLMAWRNYTAVQKRMQPFSQPNAKMFSDISVEIRPRQVRVSALGNVPMNWLEQASTKWLSLKCCLTERLAINDTHQRPSGLHFRPSLKDPL